MNKGRKIWVAVIASILVPGLGHVYCGYFVRFLFLQGILTLLFFGKGFILLWAIRQPFKPDFISIIFTISIIAIWVIALIDAILFARKHRKEYISKWYNR